jgi:hypothetical protein
MFVNRRWRRRLQRTVGPGHGRRRAFGSPDREHGRDTQVAETSRNHMRHDRATGHTARDPVTSPTAHDDHRVPNDGATARWCGCPVVRLPGGAVARWPDGVLLCPVMSGYVRLCPVMSGYVRLCPVMSGYVRLCPVMSGYVRLYPLMRGNARSLRLPGRFGTVCRGESGPTIRVRCAAGRHGDRYG